jgi:putative colanic acid biosynthesis acetyltransferase WcaF
MGASKTNLASYDNSWYQPGRNIVIRVVWYLVNLALFKSAFPLYAVKRGMLRIFGARVGKGLIIKPHVNIKYPWKLAIGDHVWIGEGVWIDNLAQVTLNNHSCISQGALLLCGNHNYKKPTFDLMVAEIILEEGAWAGANTVICPGVTLGSNSLLTVGSIAVSSLEADWIYQGNPAQKLRLREIRT